MHLQNPKRKLDYNRSIIEWEMKRNNEHFDLDKIRAGSTEWKKVHGYICQYTKWNNMLRYTDCMTNHNLDRNKDQNIDWDPFIEYLPHKYENRTAELYEERRIEKEKKELIIN